MGVKGLKSFVEKHDGLFIKDYHLHDTHVVIDASNLMSALYVASQKHERRDLFGGDLVEYRRHLMTFFNNLKRCQIDPILVMDGAQTCDQKKSKSVEKHRRALNRFQSAMSVSKLGFGDFILPATATNVFKSIAVDQGITIVQCMYEADTEISRISNKLECPVLSNDSDFFLMNLSHGFITIDMFPYEQTQRSSSTDSNKPPYYYINCSLFKQELFLNYVPRLDIECLPLVGVLAGNDFVAAGVFNKICSRLSSKYDPRDASRSFKNVRGHPQHQKIMRILNFLENKSSNQAVNLVCAQVPKQESQKLKTLIRSNLSVYDIPTADDFENQLKNLYWPGFQTTFMNKFKGESALRAEFDKTMKSLADWLRNAMEKSVLSARCLSLANQNIIFINSHMDDPRFPSAHECQIRSMRVMLAMIKSSPDEYLSSVVYDRVGQVYSKKIVRPIAFLKGFGKLKFTMYDLPRLSSSVRRSILLATFHSSWSLFESKLADFYAWFEPEHAEEYLIVKLIMEFVDIESQMAKLWKHFRQATLLCMIFYLYTQNLDRKLTERVRDGVGTEEEFVVDFEDLVTRKRLDRMPVMNKRRQYNCRLMHQITQLQSSIISFNGLNAFLGDVMTRVRTEYWLNSCLIYNLAEHLHEKTLKFPTMPEIIHLRPI